MDVSTTNQSSCNDISCDNDNSANDLTSSTSSASDVRIPIVGFEVMDERQRFTVFKLRVENEKRGDSWLVFRRYTDFVRLHQKLKEEFPSAHIPLPPKRWLRDNFETAFLEDRMKGLQAFIDSILHIHPSNTNPLTESRTVREFFCLDEPPVYPESAEESRSMFGTVEENILHLKQQLSDKELEVELLKTKLVVVSSQRDSLMKSAKSCRNCSQRLSLNSSSISHISENGNNNNNNSLSPVVKGSPSISSRVRNPSSSDQSSGSSLNSNEKSLSSSPKTSTLIKKMSAHKLNGKIEAVIEQPKVRENNENSDATSVIKVNPEPAI